MPSRIFTVATFIGCFRVSIPFLTAFAECTSAARQFAAGTVKFHAWSTASWMYFHRQILLPKIRLHFQKNTLIKT